MPRHSIELADDRPYPVRILQVPVVRGQLLDAGEPLCVLQWADDEVQRIVLDMAVVVDTLGVRAGETLTAPGTLALVHPAEDTVASLGGPASGSPDASPPPATTAKAPPPGTTAPRVARAGRRSWGMFVAFLAIAAVTGFFLAGSIYRLPLHPGLAIGLLAGCAILLALVSWTGGKGAALASFATFALAAIAAGALGGRTERHVDWLTDLPSRFGGESEPDFGGRTALEPIPLPPVPEEIPPGGPTERMLDEYVWLLSTCALLDPACVDDGTPEDCASRADALGEALPSLIPSEALEARMAIAQTPLRTDFALADGETCEEYWHRSDELHGAAVELLSDEIAFLDERAVDLGESGWAGTLEPFVEASAVALSDCSGLALLLGESELRTWSDERAFRLDAAFPNVEVDRLFKRRWAEASRPGRLSTPGQGRRLAVRCEALRKDPLLALEN